MSIDLKRLSARLGLSPTTVSRALNGYTDVSAATRERVVQMARELDYRPNSTARRLARGRADAVGIVYPLEAGDLGDPLFLQVVEGLSDHLETAQVDLLIASSRERSEMRTYERLVTGGRVDGIIVARTRVVDPRIEYLERVGIPFVAYGRTGRAEGYPWFDFDNEGGMALAVQELVKLGHEAIAYVHAPLTLNFAHQRREGFDRAMRDAGLAARSGAIVEGGMSRRSGYAAASSLLALSRRPTAIIVDNNLSGVGVVRTLLDSGVAIGQEISVLVYDGVPTDSLLREQRIAAIEQPTAHEAGRTLAEMLLTLIAGGRPDPLQVLRRPAFVNGTSVGPAPVCS